MSRKKNKYRFLFAAGGTGGHLFPAIAVAEAIMKIKPESEVLFIGTATKLESKIIPELGFKFKTLWISGFNRAMTIKNILFPVKLLVAMFQAFMINVKFKPSVALGAGAYVSGPALWGASVMGSKLILLEQNSYPGITNRLLEKKAQEIHISFEESKKYFRFQDKLFLTGNPVRTNLKLIDKSAAKRKLGLDESKKCLFILGGSLGAKSLNDAVAENLNELKKNNIQLLWQCGNRYYDELKKFEDKDIKIFSFIDDMAAFYSAADLTVARAGATTIAEVSALGLPVVFVPSPNVAANHQYKNALALNKENACRLIKDDEIKSSMKKEIVELIFNDEELKEMGSNIKKFSKPEAANQIAKRAIELAEVI